jgi:hypothetical protein
MSDVIDETTYESIGALMEAQRDLVEWYKRCAKSA